MLSSQKAANRMNNLRSPAKKKKMERDYKEQQMIILRILIFWVPTEEPVSLPDPLAPKTERETLT